MSMGRIAPWLHKQFITRLLLRSVIVLISGVPLEAAPKTPPVGPARCVFLIDTSSAMAGQKEAIGKALAARLVSGLDGQARAGEQFLIWTFNDTVSTNVYLPVVWNPRNKEASV